MTTRPAPRRLLAMITSIPLWVAAVVAPTGASPAAADPASVAETGTRSAAAGGAAPGGYWLLAADGGVFAFGSAPFHGAIGNRGADIAGMAATPSGDGYWLADNDGDVFPAGTAADFGSRPAEDDDVAAFGARPQGDGYWMVTRTGRVDAFGAAPARGGVTVRRSHRIVALAPTPTGEGYWLGALDGGIFALGDARFLGSMGGRKLNQPIVGMTATPTGNGYWLVASDGGIFTFGDAAFHGSMGGRKLNQPIVGMAAARPSAGVGGPGILDPITGTLPSLVGSLAPPVSLPGRAIPPASGGGIRFVNSTNHVTARAATSIALPVPAGYQAGDVLIATLQSDYGIVDPTPPSGWTRITYLEERGTDLTGYAFFKVAGATEPAAYTWQGGKLSDKTFIGGTMLAFRGVDTTDPIFDARVNTETSDTTKMQCPSANAPAGGMLVCLYTHDDGVTFINPPPAMTRVSYFRLPDGGKDDAHATAYELIGSAGATGPRLAGIGTVAGGQNDLEIAVVLNPAP